MPFKKTKRKGFNFFRSYYDVFNELENDKDRLAFIEALLDRQFLGIEPTDLKGMVRFAWISQVNSIDSQVKGYEDKTGLKLTPTEGGRQGGRQGGKTTPTEQVEGKEKEKEKDINISFDVFWNLYDKKVGDKVKIKKKWSSLKDIERELIIQYIPKYIASQPDKKFRKNPEAFLNNKSWNDEIINANGINDNKPTKKYTLDKSQTAFY